MSVYIYLVQHAQAKKEVVEYMMNIKNDYEILIPKPKNKNSIHPLFVIYSKNVCYLIEKNLKMKKYKVFDLIKKAKVKYVKNIPNFEKVFLT